MSTDDYPLAYDPAGVDTIQRTSSQQLMGVCMGHGNRVSSYTCDCTHYGTCIHNSSNDSFATNGGMWHTNNTHAHLGGGISQQIFASIQFKTVQSTEQKDQLQPPLKCIAPVSPCSSDLVVTVVLEFTLHRLEYQHWLRWIADRSKH